MENNIWFPYFSLKDGVFFPKVVKAKGCKIFFENGKELIDGIASWWAVCHGYQHSAIVEAIKHQAETLTHVMFGGLTHQPAEELAEKLIKFINRKELKRVFFSDSGSTAVEVGIKMALQYFYSKNQVERKNIIYFENGYHGETLGAMSVSDSIKLFFPTISEKKVLKIPQTEEDFLNLELFLKENAKFFAGAIIEPLLQGAGGMKIHKAENIKKLFERLQFYGILLIADECATGFYRTGKKFAFYETEVEPDILILGKALTGGNLPFAATIAKEFIFKQICENGRFFHGPTFMANPLCSSAAIASLKLFENEDYEEKVKNIEIFFKNKFKENGRIKGAVCAFDVPLQTSVQIKKDVSDFKLASFLRPFGKTLYLAPPLVIKEEELEVLCNDLQKYIFHFTAS